MGTHRTFRLLAEDLARAGFVALRFDYDGTGDSAGRMIDDGRVGAWSSSVVAAVALLRGAGLPRLALVGMRLGATLAAVAASEVGGVDDLVLWDPIRTGRMFVRQQQALASLSHQLAGEDTLPAGWVEAPAWVFAAETVAELGQLDMTKTTGTLAGRTLVLTRPDRPDDEKLRARFGDPGVAWRSATDQAALIDAIPSQNAVPRAAIADIVDWLGEADIEPVAVTAPPAVADEVSHGPAVTERLVRLGPCDLFGIVTEPAESGGLTGPTAVFLDVAAEHHVGPARLWVELARQWAEAGVRSLRFDLSGLGDSPSKPGQDDQLMYAPSAIDDAIAAVRATSPDDPSDVVLIGLCSGAYVAMDAADQLHPRGVCALNPVMSYRPNPFAAGPPPARPVLHGVRRRVSPDMYDRLSRLRFLGREVVSVALDRLQRVELPRTVLRRIAAEGTDVLLVAGAQLIAGPPVPPRAGLLPPAGPKLRVVSPDDLDHSLLASKPRDRVAQLLTDHVLRLARRDRR
jgi:alpha-beta hydrolase superfamily lysophospholipase